MTQKDNAVSFLKMAGGGDVRAAYEKFVSPTFIHHNQYFKGDRESLLVAMEAAHQKSPNKYIDIRKVFEDGNNVITHSHVVRRDSSQPEVAVVHIFTFEKGKIAELWDLGMPLIKDSPNENGVF